MIEDIQSWVTTAASVVTLVEVTYKLLKWLLPKMRESLKMWRSCRRKH